MFNLTEKDRLNKIIIEKSRENRDLRKENRAVYRENKEVRFENEELRDKFKEVYKLATCNKYDNKDVFFRKIKELAETVINN